MDNKYKKHIVLIVGTRPNFIKAFPVYKALINDFTLTLIHTGQHFNKNMSDVFFNQLNFPKPDIHLTIESKLKADELDTLLYDGNLINGSVINNIERIKYVINELIMCNSKYCGQFGEIRDKLEIELNMIRPDMVIVFGDVTSTLAGAICCWKLDIELIHVESGLRSGDLTMPEEVNRILVDYMSKYLFVTEKSGVTNLQNEGIIENVYLVGNTMIDTQKKFLSKALYTNYNKDIGNYVLVTLHRPSNVDNLVKFEEIYNDLIELSKYIKIIYPIHHRTRENLRKMTNFDNNSNIFFLEPLGYLEFTCLIANSQYVITDSGGIQEETTALNIPCFTLRNNTERPITLIQNGGTNQLIESIQDIKPYNNIYPFNNKLWDGHASERICKILKEVE